ncbi:gastrula zinc finger protein xFG20-1-like [Culex quinquefasciatus]|uniref:gastrula zinc finger protein xFG20-1-like n=1 Tax=Culex quinquefasciatus TaxID=7176 RepID=UPI0018E3A86E|nr:gastrula zinc finger protein xFG20-1-like [Culex quinquefasciatus]
MDIYADLCRLCRVRNEEQPAEEWPHLFHVGNEHLLKKIRACTNVCIIERDPLPKRICFRCQAALELAHTFRLQCDKADARWQRQLELVEKVGQTAAVPETVPLLEAETVPVADATEVVRFFYRGPNDKRFVCRFCPRHFSRKCRLKEHEAQHTETQQEATPQKESEEHSAIAVKQELDILDVFESEELPTTDMSAKEPQSEPVLSSVDKSMLDDNNRLRENEVNESVPVTEAEPPAKSPLEMGAKPPTEEVRYFYRGPGGPNTWNKRFQCRFCPRHFGRKCRLREHEAQHKETQQETPPMDVEVADPVAVKQEPEVFVVEELPTSDMSLRELESVPVLNSVGKSMLEMDDNHRVREHEISEPVSVSEGEQVSVYEPLTESTLQMAVEPPTGEVRFFYRGPSGPNSWNKRFQCQFCPRHFGRKCRLREHEMRHSGVQRFPCASCSRSFYSERDRIVHQEHMHGNSPFACSKCGIKFKTQEGLDKHDHTKPRNHKCDLCLKAFTTKQGLEYHKQRHAKADYSKLRGQDLNRICMCPHCGHISHSHNAHVLHLRTHTGGQDSATESESSITPWTQEVNSS